MKNGLVAAASLVLVAVLLAAGLSSFGIWDPWELEAADAARRIAEGRGGGDPQLTAWVVSLGFRPFGVHEWAGRLPVAVCGFATVAFAFALVARGAGRRTGLYAAWITATSPLFLFNARTMLGEAPAFALQSAVALTGAAAVLPARAMPPAQRLLLLASWLGAIAGAVLGRGALLAALPPVAAVALTACLEERHRPATRGMAEAATTWFACALTLALAARVGFDVAADRAAFSPWIGGRPGAGAPPRFDAVLEHVFHAFAPWSALLPLALARMPSDPPLQSASSASSTDDKSRAERSLRLFVLTWAAAGYGAQTLFVSRYGQDVTYLPVVALAATVALLLRDLERARERNWPMAIAAAFLAGLVLRDFALYPGAPAEGLAAHGVEIPKAVNPRLAWAACLGCFALTMCVALGAAQVTADLRAPYRWLTRQWRRGFGFRAWLGGAVLILIACVAFGTLAWAAPEKLRVTTQAIRWGKALALVPLAIPLAAAGVQWLVHLQARLVDLRFAGVLGTGAAVGAFSVFGYMAQLSAQLSPREIYESYNRLAKQGEPLAEYKVGGRAATYYARGPVREVSHVSELTEYLSVKERRWAAFPSESLAEIDRAFRRRTQAHLFVVDASSERVMLVTNQPILGRKNDSFLVQSVRDDAPAIQHPLHARFEDRIEFLGYDLDLPHGDHAGAGESFGVTWYFRCLAPVGGDYRVFVHIDGQDQRIHGDHDPIDGKYPPRLWDTGDVIVDRQRLDVPGSYRAGDYTIYLGFYQGEKRLTVEEGPKDDVNRVRAGVLRIR